MRRVSTIRAMIAFCLSAGSAVAGCASDGGTTIDSGPSRDPATTSPAIVPATDTPATDPPVSDPTSAPTEPTTTAATTTTEPEPTALDELGYPVSDEWVVESVVRGIDAGTGGLALDDDGVMYMGDWGYPNEPGNRVLRITQDGEIETFVESDLMESMTMSVFADDGTLYQSSYNSDRVFAIDPDGEAQVVAEGIRGPTGIVPMDDGTLFVEAYDADTIHRVLPDGTVEDFVFDRVFKGLNGLAIGPDGTLYAAEHQSGGLHAIDPEGTITTLHDFPEPTSHVVYHQGSLFVTSRGAYVVFRYDLDSGDVEIIAGNGEPGDRDGRGGDASFGRPNAITVGPDGDLYFNHGVGDTNAPVTIRRIRHDP